MIAFFLAGAGTSAGRQGAKLGLYCSAWGSSCLCQLFSLFVSFFQLRVKVLRCRLGLRRCKRTERVSLSGRILGAQSLVLGSTCRFCLQCFVPLPSAVFSYVQTSTTLLMSARSSFHRGNSTFLMTPSMCCVFICTNSRHTLKTSLCCAFYWRKPFHDHTSICCGFICTHPNQTSILGSGGNLQLPKKEIT